MGPFTQALTSLAIHEILDQQNLAKWRSENTFHVPVVALPLQFLVEGTLITIHPGWKPPTINVGPLPSMAVPPTNWL
jgi:hypothetical protein